ncbi:hypothetical protein GALMADRAFT_1025173 [Galerina marginata CBS 339.88]|uniref:Uncharacterized protein n=1 Tax=Galerina marginata (strain CBS 339.88) TaxID=685588 RepID=A0A067SLW0_GALM3|nr:hypothetical protein GALMADRAFT_1025173 [Galerina marginata CBS 339.88]
MSSSTAIDNCDNAASKQLEQVVPFVEKAEGTPTAVAIQDAPSDDLPKKMAMELVMGAQLVPLETIKAMESLGTQARQEDEEFGAEGENTAVDQADDGEVSRSVDGSAFKPAARIAHKLDAIPELQLTLDDDNTFTPPMSGEIRAPRGPSNQVDDPDKMHRDIIQAAWSEFVVDDPMFREDLEVNTKAKNDLLEK